MQGYRHAALSGLIKLAPGAFALAFYSQVLPGGRLPKRKGIHEAVSVEGDPSTLLGVAREALSSLASDREPTTNFETLTASIVTPRSTWSFGEEVTVCDLSSRQNF
jgi:hypothetical protein